MFVINVDKLKLRIVLFCVYVVRVYGDNSVNEVVWYVEKVVLVLCEILFCGSSVCI